MKYDCVSSQYILTIDDQIKVVIGEPDGDPKLAKAECESVMDKIIKWRFE